MDLNDRAKAYQASRKTKPLTQEEIDAIVEPVLEGDTELGQRVHKALIERMRLFNLYGKDIGKEEFLKVLLEVQEAYRKAHEPYRGRFSKFIRHGLERQSDETTGTTTPNARNSNSEIKPSRDI